MRYQKRRGRGKYKRVKPISAKGFTKEFLILLVQTGGVVALSSLAGPRGPKLFLKFGKHAYWRLANLMKRLEKQRYLEREKREREDLIKITDYGRQKAAFYALQGFKLHKPARWDGRWRMLIFDVPEEVRARRDFVRRVLKDQKFYQLQKSVFITPYPCNDLHELLCEAVGLRGCMHLLEIASLGTSNDEVLRYFSELKLSSV